jgi:hypothetical protein
MNALVYRLLFIDAVSFCIDRFSSMITPSPKAGIAFGEGWGGVAPYQLDIPKDRIRFYSFQGQSMASVAKQAALPESS